MTYKELKYSIYTDLFRVAGITTKSFLLKSIIFNEGFTYIFWMRICNYLRFQKIMKLFFYLPAKGMLRHYSHKYGISIPFTTKIGKGFYIGHYGGIFVNQNSVIGDNCNFSQDVTLGIKNRGNNSGTPVIGNNVYIGPGAKIIGGIRIGNNAAVGANCVVTKDVPENGVVVGIPGKVISEDGSEGYINYTNYSGSGQ